MEQETRLYSERRQRLYTERGVESGGLATIQRSDGEIRREGIGAQKRGGGGEGCTKGRRGQRRAIEGGGGEGGKMRSSFRPIKS